MQNDKKKQSYFNCVKPLGWISNLLKIGMFLLFIGIGQVNINAQDGYTATGVSPCNQGNSDQMSKSCKKCCPKKYDAIFKAELLKLINEYRKANGVAPLEFDPVLDEAAQKYAEYGAAHPKKVRVDGHRADGSNPYDRILKVAKKYNYTIKSNSGRKHAFEGPVGENAVVFLEYCAEDAFKRWKTSPHHDKQMKNEKYVHIGIGVACGVGPSGGNFFFAINKFAAKKWEEDQGQEIVTSSTSNPSTTKPKTRSVRKAKPSLNTPKKTKTQTQTGSVTNKPTEKTSTRRTVNRTNRGGSNSVKSTNTTNATKGAIKTVPIFKEGNTLLANQSLKAEGAWLTLEGEFVSWGARVLDDGSFIGFSSGDGFFNSNTANSGPNCELKMQSDGNLALYDKNNKLIWSSKTNVELGGNKYSAQDWKPVKLVLEPNLLVLYSVTGKKVWTSDMPTESIRPTPVNNSISSGKSMKVNDRINSPDGKHYLVMQSDGNVVIYTTKNNNPIWATDTYGSGNGCHFDMQEDGHLVLYNAYNEAIWASGTHVSRDSKYAQKAWKPVKFVFENGGHLVLYSDTGKKVWSSKNEKGKKL